jgi:hypothetical protein
VLPGYPLRFVEQDINLLSALPVVKRAEEIIHELRTKESCHMVVCLFHGPLGQGADFLEAVPDIDVMIVGHGTRQVSPVHRMVGKTVVAGLPEKGRFLGVLSLELDGDFNLLKVESEALAASRDVESHPRGVRIYDEYVQALRKDPIQPDQRRMSEPFVGSKTCGRCHEHEWNHWSSTPHAIAFGELKRCSQELNPECLQCHTTGYGAEGGFVSEQDTPGLVGVGCETCHGPRKKHALEKEALEKEGKVKPPVRVRSERTLPRVDCMQCHTIERDRNFGANIDLRTGKIKHR